jgi:hypothetical protein
MKMKVSVTITSPEAEAIRRWYEHANDDSFHYGGAALLLPSDRMSLKKLENAEGSEVQLSRNELDTIIGWMEKSVGGRYGSDRYLIGIEQQLYYKLKGEE